MRSSSTHKSLLLSSLGLGWRGGSKAAFNKGEMRGRLRNRATWQREGGESGSSQSQTTHCQGERERGGGGGGGGGDAVISEEERERERAAHLSGRGR